MITTLKPVFRGILVSPWLYIRSKMTFIYAKIPPLNY